MFSAITPLLLFCAFLLLLLISLSLPIIKSIYVFQLAANIKEGVGIVSASGSETVRFGVWGYCTSAGKLSAFGQGINATPAECTKAHLGYRLDNTVANALHVSSLVNILSKGVTAALVLHPIACGLTFLALVFSLMLLRRPSAGTRISSALTLGMSLLAAFITTIVFLIDVIFVAVVRKDVRKATDGIVTGSYGPVVWMALGATILLWISCVGACAGICACGGRRRKNQTDTY
ncbi:pali-domain-containing protein [Rickenella mellea]|uniref:Pali-domain-containing protein n=1 Tax=Rickenella mellea TaxID=50990 RepID=A0A4Y7QIA5_9AGAM|nr:pali-domain-containing protein [Rickenella mellea]